MAEVAAFVDVIIPRPIAHALTYSLSAQLVQSVAFGSAVRVPFRRGLIEGFVVGVHATCPAHTGGKAFEIKAVQEVIGTEPVFSQKDYEFYCWIAEYYQASIGDVFFNVFPKVYLTTPKRKQKIKEPHLIAINDVGLKVVELTDDQQSAFTRIASAVKENRFESFLLFGVTGSGKTEVYMRAAREALDRGRSTIILVPEIALTPQLRTRFEERFGEEVAVLHSSLGEATRRGYWRDILEGKRRIVVGARSAIFAPLKNIGLIVVDEEHEPSYKQEGHLRYHARDLAIVRAKQHGAPIILGSATPSIETFFATENGKHTLLELRTRPKNRPMPKVEIIHLGDERKAGLAPLRNIGQQLHSALIETIERGEQAMIFFNRKGFSSYLMCGECAHVPGCANCSVSLTYYKTSSTMKCHYCGYSQRAPTECEKCFGREFRYMGFGTENVEAELRQLLPNARIARLDAETASTTKKLESILNSYRSGEIQILVGTQMLAKGHDFPGVTLIGVVLAEMGMHIPDFRAGERTFQLLSQVSGRAGRGDMPGRVILQTYMPDNDVIQCALTHDYRRFYAAEILCRREFGYPPFSRMAQLEFRDKNEARARTTAEQAAEMIRKIEPTAGHSLELLGPTPAAISKVAQEYRWQLLLKAEKITALNSYLKTIRRSGVRLIDVDPVNPL